MYGIDVNLFFLINHGMSTALLDVLMPVLTNQGYLLVIPALFTVIYKGSAVRDAAGKTYVLNALLAVFLAFCAFPLADGVGDVIKNLVARPRPCHVLEGVRLLVPCPDSYSLPSGHAIASFAFAAPLFVLTRKYLPLFWRCYPLALASVIAFSRPYVGVHYPSDILIGTVLGVAVSMPLCMPFILRERAKEKRGRPGLHG